MLLTKNISIIMLSLRFSEILADDENKLVFVYLFAALLETIKDHPSSLCKDGYEPFIAVEGLD
jgi:chromatin segregation and condensation protein Rec8/ScpA/Scc1 (kleisin family)